jgi:hypothetical protein
MIIESVAAAGMLLQQINTVIQNVNEAAWRFLFLC